MKSKNSKERNISFVKFLGLFLLSVITIVITVYFNFEVPETENELLKEEAKVFNKEVEFQDDFYNEMVVVKNMIDSLDTPGQNVSYQNNLISSKLVALQEKIPTKDATSRYDMYTSIIKTYVELQEAKGRLNSLKTAESTIEEYKEALETCREDLKESERELYIARNSN